MFLGTKKVLCGTAATLVWEAQNFGVGDKEFWCGRRTKRGLWVIGVRMAGEWNGCEKWDIVKLARWFAKMAYNLVFYLFGISLALIRVNPLPKWGRKSDWMVRDL